MNNQDKIAAMNERFNKKQSPAPKKPGIIQTAKQIHQNSKAAAVSNSPTCMHCQTTMQKKTIKEKNSSAQLGYKQYKGWQCPNCKYSFKIT